jgi:hypothetical protein
VTAQLRCRLRRRTQRRSSARWHRLPRRAVPADLRPGRPGG